MTDVVQDTIRLLMHILTYDILMGYGLYSIVYVSISLFKKNNQFLNKLDVAACRVVIWSGIIYFLLFIADNTWSSLTAETDIERFAIATRMFGPYWFVFFYTILLYALLPQLLWMDKIRRLKIFRIVTGVLLMVPFEVFVIFITSLHRDYFDSSRTMPLSFPELFFGMLLKMMIFVVIAWIYYSIDERLKRNHATAPLDL